MGRILEIFRLCFSPELRFDWGAVSVSEGGDVGEPPALESTDLRGSCCSPVSYLLRRHCPLLGWLQLAPQPCTCTLPTLGLLWGGRGTQQELRKWEGLRQPSDVALSDVQGTQSPGLLPLDWDSGSLSLVLVLPFTHCGTSVRPSDLCGPPLPQLGHGVSVVPRVLLRS